MTRNEKTGDAEAAIIDHPDPLCDDTRSNSPIAIVTGAATGIGRAVAEKLISEDWIVHICDIDLEALKRVTDTHPNIHASVANVADQSQVNSVVQNVFQTYGKIDALINNAGVSGMTAPVEDFDADNWRQTIDINVNGSFYFVREVVPIMKSSGHGSIINIASTAALFGYPQRSAYAAAKWAIIGFTKTLAMELGPCGIRVNAVCPGSVKGPRIDRVIDQDAVRRNMPPADVRSIYEAQVSMREFVTAEDVANMCAFLASDRSRMVSGQVIAVDGHTESLSFPFK